MKVFIVLEYDAFDYCRVDEVYLDKNLAQKRKERLSKQKEDRSFHIIEKEVRTPPNLCVYLVSKVQESDKTSLITINLKSDNRVLTDERN